MNKTITYLKMAVIAVLFMNAGSPAFLAAQTNYIQAPQTINGTSSGSRGPNGAVDFQRTAALYLGSEVVGKPATAPITAVGFSIDQPATAPATGTIKIYMMNTPDAVYSIGTDWATFIPGFTLVYNGPLTIPATAGVYNIALTTPFAHSGGGFYLAYEWTTTVKSPATASYYANTALTGGVKTATGTALPATLNLSSNFRPVLSLGFTPNANDLDVQEIFTRGKFALNFNSADTISVAVKNVGINQITGRVLTLTISGGNTYNSTAIIPDLASGKDTVVKFFPAFMPANHSASNLVRVITTPDDNAVNDTAEANIEVTSNTIGYAQYPATGISTSVTSALGGSFPLTAPTFTNRNGKMLTRFYAPSPVNVTKVRTYITGPNLGSTVNTIGATVYAVVLNSTGTELARSANKTITAALADSMVEFDLTQPGPAMVTAGTYYIGLVIPPQPSATAWIYPLGLQEGNAIWMNRFYVAPSAGNSQPLDYEDAFRFIIEADLATSTVGVKESLNSKLVSVYPNPSNGTFHVSAKAMKGNNATMEVRNIQGKVVYSAKASKEETSINLNNLSAGVYMLRVATDQEIAIKRIVIK